MILLVFLSFLLLATGALALPPTLEDTGFSEATATAFAPQYPLWSDGSEKRRWLSLPAGASVDTSNPDAWQFPPGTKAWKEFSRDGRRIETRFIERLADGSWRYATYLWNDQGTQAVLAPAQGIGSIPSRADCLACHEGAAVPILGYSAVQLKTKLPAALGYLHGNCGHCHNDSGPLANVELVLAQRMERNAKTSAGVRSRAEPILRKMKSRNPLTRMPPLGVSIPDDEGIALVERWLSQPELSP